MKPSPSKRDGHDQRTGVNYDLEASTTPTFTTETKQGCSLTLPYFLLAENAGTLTREEYYWWREGIEEHGVDQ